MALRLRPTLPRTKVTLLALQCKVTTSSTRNKHSKTATAHITGSHRVLPPVVSNPAVCCTGASGLYVLFQNPSSLVRFDADTGDHATLAAYGSCKAECLLFIDDDTCDAGLPTLKSQGKVVISLTPTSALNLES